MSAEESKDMGIELEKNVGTRVTKAILRFERNPYLHICVAPQCLRSRLQYFVNVLFPIAFSIC
jgi:hypothetical protein